MALKTVGALWKPKKESKAVATGTLDLAAIGYLMVAAANGEDGRIMIFRNDSDDKKDKAPDFRLVISVGEEERRGGEKPTSSQASDEQVPF